MRILRTVLSSFLVTAAAVLPVSAHADGAERAHPALWTIADDDTTITLFGTVHVMRPEVDWFHGDVRRAFDEADELVLEALSLDPAEEQALAMEYGLDPSEGGLRSKLADDERERYDEAMRSVGLAPDSLDPFKPWMAAATLSVVPMMEAGYSVELGVDEVLSGAADEAGKRTIGLETTEQQLGFFDAIDAELQLAMLNETVLQLDELGSMVREMDELWSTGNAEGLGTLVQGAMSGYGTDERIAERLLTDRNRAWANWVEERMTRPGSVFLAVGAGHLAGDDSLLEFLEAKGYEVERVRREGAPID